jgi:hypothetical protein
MYVKVILIFGQIFVKSFFLTKTSCTYMMNYLRQE